MKYTRNGKVIFERDDKEAQEENRKRLEELRKKTHPEQHQGTIQDCCGNAMNYFTGE
jgi:hypothetical protein